MPALRHPAGRGRAPALGRALNENIGTVKGWFLPRRNGFPLAHCLAVVQDRGCSYEWLAFGVGDPPPWLGQPASPAKSVLHAGPATNENKKGDTLSHLPPGGTASFFAPPTNENKKSATVAGPQTSAPALNPLAQASTERNPSATVAGPVLTIADGFQPLTFPVQPPGAPLRVSEPEAMPDAYTKALIAGGAPGLRALPLAGDGTPLAGGCVMAPSSTSPSVPLVIPVRFGDIRSHQTQRDFEVLPTFRVSASAGPGLQNAPDAVLDQAGYVAIDRAWMREQFGRAGGGYATVEVHGDSMQPTLTNGETIVVDTTVDRVDVSGIYIVRSGLDFLVKRVQRNLDGSLVIMSDNPSYASEAIPVTKTRTIEILGRMVGGWVRR